MSDRLAELRLRLGVISDLEHAAGLLAWDEETKMPPAGAEVRAEQRATLNRASHELQISPDLGQLLEDLRALEEASAFESFEAA